MHGFRCGIGIALAVALLGLGAAAPVAGASPQTTITFGQLSDAIIVSGGGSGTGITFNFQPATNPLPRKFVIEVPAGYQLDLSQAPGATIAFASVAVYGVDSASIADGSGALVAHDPAKPDPAAQACAPGKHAAVWAFSTTIAGQNVAMTILVDMHGGGGSAVPVTYMLTACPTGLSGGNGTSEASISIGALGALGSPTEAGRYLWRTLVTPQSGQEYELQAVVPVPESVTLSGRYDRKHRTAVLTGRVVEGGKPAPRTELYVAGEGGNTDLFPKETKTNAAGRFTLRFHIKHTTDFDATVQPSSTPCTETTAPGGCLGSSIVPPDDGFTTVWVSVRGGPVRATRPGDQRRAERENLRAADFPTGFQLFAGGGDACENPRHESDLTITGESTSPEFVKFVQLDPVIVADASGVARVYATAKQARAAFAREARQATVRCELAGAPKGTTIGRLGVGGVAAQARAFRTEVTQENVTADFDFVFLRRRRSVALLQFVFVGVPTDVEQPLIRKVAARLG
jgi:hypothetical protein